MFWETKGHYWNRITCLPDSGLPYLACWLPSTDPSSCPTAQHIRQLEDAFSHPGIIKCTYFTPTAMQAARSCPLAIFTAMAAVLWRQVGPRWFSVVRLSMSNPWMWNLICCHPHWQPERQRKWNPHTRAWAAALAWVLRVQELCVGHSSNQPTLFQGWGMRTNDPCNSLITWTWLEGHFLSSRRPKPFCPKYKAT